MEHKIDEIAKQCLEDRHKNVWYLSKLIGSGFQGFVFKLCKDPENKDCTNILKIVNDDIDRETRNQKKCSKIFSFVLPIVDNWSCENRGIIITKFLPISFEDFILSKEHMGKKICIIHKIILYIYEMHTKCDIFHLDLHLKNIMMDTLHKPYFIDFGSSVDISNKEDVVYYKRFYDRQMYPKEILDGHSYIAIAKNDYGKFIYRIIEFVKKSYNVKDYPFLEEYLIMANEIVLQFSAEIKNYNQTIDNAKKFEKQILESYNQQVTLLLKK